MDPQTCFVLSLTGVIFLMMGSNTESLSYMRTCHTSAQETCMEIVLFGALVSEEVTKNLQRLAKVYPEIVYDKIQVMSCFTTRLLGLGNQQVFAGTMKDNAERCGLYLAALIYYLYDDHFGYNRDADILFETCHVAVADFLRQNLISNFCQRLLMTFLRVDEEISSEEDVFVQDELSYYKWDMVAAEFEWMTTAFHMINKLVCTE